MITSGNDKPEVVLSYFPKTTDISARCSFAYSASRKLAERVVAANPFTDVYAFIEEPVVGRGGAYATIVQAKLHGAIIAGLRHGGAEVKGVNNSSAKKAVVGKGNAGKPDIKRWCQVYWREVFDEALKFPKGDQQDVFDGAMINRHGAIIIGTMTRLREYRAREGGLTPRRRSLPLKRKRAL